jgi:hypothetical protein
MEDEMHSDSASTALNPDDFSPTASPGSAQEAHALQFRPVWQLAAEARHAEELVAAVRERLAAVPAVARPVEPHPWAALVAGGAAAIACGAALGLAGEPGAWTAPMAAACAVGAVGGALVWSAQRRAQMGLGSAAAAWTALALGGLALVLAAAVLWPQPDAPVAAVAKAIAGAVAAGLAAMAACYGGVAEVQAYVQTRDQLAKLSAQRGQLEAELQSLFARIAQIRQALPLAYGAGRGCLALYESKANRVDLERVHPPAVPGA